MFSSLPTQNPLISLAVQGTILLLFGVILIVLSRQRGQARLRCWSASWFALSAITLGFIGVLYVGRFQNDDLSKLVSIVAQAGGWLHPLLLLVGTLEFVHRKSIPRVAFLVGIGACLLIAVVTVQYGQQSALVMAARIYGRSLLSAALMGGLLVLRLRRGSHQQSLGEWVFYGALALFAIEHAHYTTVMLGMQFSGWNVNYLVNFRQFHQLFQILLGLGMILMVTDQLQRRVRRNSEALMQAEDEFRQHHRIEAVTTLAGGIAHDFNNLLTAIVGYCDLVEEELPPGSASRQDLESVRVAVGRATALTRELQSFSRRAEMSPQRVDPGESLRRLRRAIDRSLGDSIRFEMSIPDQVPAIFVDPAHFELLLMNLAINAKAAMPQGGVLRLAVETEQIVEGASPSMRGGKAVVLEIQDSGRGMDEATRRRVFEPYFTTREEPRSMIDGLVPGMGLSACYGFVRQSGGEIEVQSAVGEGTTFRIFFPEAEEAPSPLPRPRSLRGSETVLLVEDESPIRDLVVRTLRRQGYKVLSAASGVDALMVAEGYRDAIDLLLTDVVMPRMSGQAMSRALVGIHAEARTLFMTGYTAQEMEERGMWVPDRMLTKPFSAEQLVREIREVLDGPGQSAGVEQRNGASV